jgi:hypothetical protein
MSVLSYRNLFAVGALAVLPTLAAAHALDSGLTCNLRAHDFVAPLVEDGLIGAKPSRVEDNSVNAFFPTRGADLRAFGFLVIAIVGYQKDDLLFKHGDGAPIGDSAYGAVVFGSTSSVKAKVDAAGSRAIVHHVGPFITAIFCDKNV